MVERFENLSLDVVDMDVTDEASVDVAVRHVLARAGRVDVMINNVGVAAIGVTEAYAPEQFQLIYDVNVCGAVCVNRAVLPSMRQQRSGLLIHVSSGAGRVAIPALAAYCASKFALEALADAYRFELLPELAPMALRATKGHENRCAGKLVSHHSRNRPEQ